MMKEKLNSRKGFTLAELLIVIAIIAVLTAIAIPLFSTQLEKSREATDLANIRSAYAEAMSAYMTKGDAVNVTVDLKQTKAKWQSVKTPVYIGSEIKAGSGSGATTTGQVEVTGEGTNIATVAVTADGDVTIKLT